MSSSEIRLPLLPCERLGLQTGLALAGELPRAALMLDHADALARLRYAVESEHLHGLARERLVDAVAHEVVHRADAAPVGAGDERVADLERAADDQDRHHRATARVELRLDHGARCGRLGVRAQLHQLGLRDDRVEQRVETFLGLGGHVDEADLAAPVDRLQADAGHLAADPVRVGALLVDLVDGDDHRDARLLGVVDRLLFRGLTPSSAATTITAMSVTLAPRARIAVNASWPGVSRNVTDLSPWWTW